MTNSTKERIFIFLLDVFFAVIANVKNIFKFLGNYNSRFTTYIVVIIFLPLLFLFTSENSDTTANNSDNTDVSSNYKINTLNKYTAITIDNSDHEYGFYDSIYNLYNDYYDVINLSLLLLIIILIIKILITKIVKNRSNIYSLFDFKKYILKNLLHILFIFSVSFLFIYLDNVHPYLKSADNYINKYTYYFFKLPELSLLIHVDRIHIFLIFAIYVVIWINNRLLWIIFIAFIQLYFLYRFSGLISNIFNSMPEKYFRVAQSIIPLLLASPYILLIWIYKENDKYNEESLKREQIDLKLRELDIREKEIKLKEREFIEKRNSS